MKGGGVYTLKVVWRKFKGNVKRFTKEIQKKIKGE